MDLHRVPEEKDPGTAGSADRVAGLAAADRAAGSADRVAETADQAAEAADRVGETADQVGETAAGAAELASNNGTAVRNGLEAAMVNVGSLVTYIVTSAVRNCGLFLRKIFFILVKGSRPFIRELLKYLALRLESLRKSFSGKAAVIRLWKSNFAERRSEVGFGRALALLFSDVRDSVRDGRKLAGTVINYTVPVVCLVFLFSVISDKTSADYGVTVEYNGQELGLVSEEAVLDNAQEVIADRAAFYDTGSDTYITATLSLKPLGAGDTVITEEQIMADVIQEQVDAIQIPEAAGQTDGQADGQAASQADGQAASQADGQTAGQADGQAASQADGQTAGQADGQTGRDWDRSPAEGEALDASAADEAIGREAADGRERAYVVSVDGQIIGAVRDNSEIEQYFEELKEEYDGDDIVEVSFDRDIEYTYEQYVDPDQIVDQQDIIDKFNSNVTEPAYYEIKEGDNPWNIARDNGMTTDELKDCTITYKGELIDDITEYCPIGAMVQLSEEVPYLQVLTTKEVEYTETIDYEIVKTEDPDMYKGDSVVDVAGVEGEKQVTALVTYRGGKRVSSEVIDETVLSEPVTKYVRVGTRETTTPVSTGSGGSGDYFWPVDGGYISAYQGDGRGHKGIDIAAPYGTPIYAAESGTVSETGGGWNGGYGNCVKISHDDGNVTVYAHMSSIAISYGDYVVKGQLIGYVGSTGDSTGNHLHFEVRSYGTYANPLDYVSQ